MKIGNFNSGCAIHFIKNTVVYIIFDIFKCSFELYNIITKLQIE